MSLIIENLSVVYRDGDHSIQAVEEAIACTVKEGGMSRPRGGIGIRQDNPREGMSWACFPRTPKQRGRILLNDRDMDFLSDSGAQRTSDGERFQWSFKTAPRP